MAAIPRCCSRTPPWPKLGAAERHLAILLPAGSAAADEKPLLLVSVSPLYAVVPAIVPRQHETILTITRAAPVLGPTARL